MVLQEILMRWFRILAVGIAPIALTACVEIEPAIGSPTATAPLAGVDLGSSGRVPQVAALAGEGEGYGRTEPNPAPTDHNAMPGMGHAVMGHGAMSGMSHGSTDPSAMPGMADGSMGHGAVPATRRPAQDKMAAAPGDMLGKRHGSGTGDMQMAHSGHAHAQGTGTVNSVDAAAHKVNVSHGPISGIGWPAMTMDFAVAPAVDLSAVKPGTRIRFDMEQGQDGMYVIRSITPTGGLK